MQAKLLKQPFAKFLHEKLGNAGARWWGYYPGTEVAATLCIQFRSCVHFSLGKMGAH